MPRNRRKNKRNVPPVTLAIIACTEPSTVRAKECSTERPPSLRSQTRLRRVRGRCSVSGQTRRDFESFDFHAWWSRREMPSRAHSAVPVFADEAFV